MIPEEFNRQKSQFMERQNGIPAFAEAIGEFPIKRIMMVLIIEDSESDIFEILLIADIEDPFPQVIIHFTGKVVLPSC
jgi:hypothetical protein